MRSYWDETRDAGKFSSSPVFSATTGVGGSGKGAQNCVMDGPFANLTVNIGPGFKSQPRCVNRKITDGLSSQCGTSYVTKAVSGATYSTALDAIYSGPHLYGHMALSMMVRLATLLTDINLLPTLDIKLILPLWWCPRTATA